MSTDTPIIDDDSDEPDIFEQLYDDHQEAIDDLAGSDNPAAPLAEMVRDEARGETDG